MYVNYLGQEIGLIAHPAPKKEKPQKGSTHNGWRVQGIPPGSLEEAKAHHARLCVEARTNPRAKMPPPFDDAKWIMNAKRRPVRSKPYEVQSAAQECARLAERAGWLGVNVVELVKEVA